MPLPGLDAEQMSGIREKDLGRLWGCASAEVIHCGDADGAAGPVLRSCPEWASVGLCI